LKYKGGLYITLPTRKRNVSSYKVLRSPWSCALLVGLTLGTHTHHRTRTTAPPHHRTTAPPHHRTTAPAHDWQLPSRERYTNMTDIVTRWFAIRFNPETFVVNTGDYTFAKYIPSHAHPHAHAHRRTRTRSS
jgi:hypothetical protein